MANSQEQTLIDFGPFKGIDNWSAGYYVDPKRATDMINYLPISHAGSLFSTLGRVVLTTNPPDVNPILGLTRFDITDAPSQYLAVSDSTLGVTAGLWQAAAGATNWTPLTIPGSVTLTPSSISYFQQFLDYDYMVDGIDQVIKIDSSFNVTPAQGAAPTQAPTLGSGGSGNLTGVYYYRFTFANSYQETSAGPISLAFTASAQAIDITNIPASYPDPQFNIINIYRLGGTWSTWLYVGSTTAGTSSVTDNLADVDVIGAQLVIFRDVPPDAWTICSYQARMWLFGQPDSPMGLYYSNYNEPWGYDTTNQFFLIGPDSIIDYAQQLASIGSLLVLFKKMTTWAVYGNDPTSFVPIKLFDIGCIAPRSVAAALGVVFWLSRDGVWMFDGAKPTRISTNIESTILNLDLDSLGRATGAYYYGFYILSFPAQSVSFVYDLISQEWYKIGWAGEVVYFDASVGEVTASRPGVGNVDSWFAASTDLGTDIAASFIGKIDDSQQPQAQKRYRWAVVVAPIQSGQTATLTLTYEPGASQFVTMRSIDLGQDLISKLLSLPTPSSAYECQVTIGTISDIQVEIDRVQIWGWQERQFSVASMS